MQTCPSWDTYVYLHILIIKRERESGENITVPFLLIPILPLKSFRWNNQRRRNPSHVHSGCNLGRQLTFRHHLILTNEGFTKNVSTILIIIWSLQFFLIRKKFSKNCLMLKTHWNEIPFCFGLWKVKWLKKNYFLRVGWGVWSHSHICVWSYHCHQPANLA